MALRRFGAGIMFGVGPQVGSVPPTPVAFGALQDVTLDCQFTNKELYGQNIFPEAVGRGQAKVTGKAKHGRVNGNLFNSLFFGQSLVAGQTLLSLNEGGPNGTAIPGTPFQITVVNGATFVMDLGVIVQVAGASALVVGQPMTRVASAPATGQYSVNTATGVYTFASADNVSGVKVTISYTYTSASGGFSLAVNQALQGLAPNFQVVLSDPDPSGAGGMQGILYACVADKLSLPTKNGDFGITEFDWMCQANAAGNVMLLSTSE